MKYRARVDGGLGQLTTTWLCGLLAVMICAPFASALEDERAFNPRRLLPPFPPITDFEVKLVAAVTDQMNPAELLIGVELNGKSRAYPVNMLTGPEREIINDQLAGTAIAATW